MKHKMIKQLRLTDQRGFSLMEMVIAAGIGSIVAMMAVTTLKQTVENHYEVENVVTADEAISDISEELKRLDICSNFLGPNGTYVNGQPLPSTSAPGSSEVEDDLEVNRLIRNGLDTVNLFVPVVNSNGEPATVLGRNLYIKKFSIGPYIENDPGDATDDVIRLNIEFQKRQSDTPSDNPSDLSRREAWLRIKVNSGRIINCASVGGDQMPP